MRKILIRIKWTIKHCIWHLRGIIMPKQTTKKPLEALSCPKSHIFIGYYDIQPFSADQSLIIYNKKPLNSNDLEIGTYNILQKEFTSIDTVPTWCLQQGCRLQWINRDKQEALLYNTLKDGQLITTIYDPYKAKTIETFPYATYAVSQNLKYVVSLDFYYLEQCRPGYGYKNSSINFENQQHTYLDIYDAATHQRITRLTTEAVAAINPHPTIRNPNSIHYFNHAHFNPSGTRLMVFHIWELEGKRRVRAITMDIDGTNIYDVTRSTHVSHYWWLDDDTLLFYNTDPAHGMGYHIYNQTGGYIKTLSGNIPKLDGHPSLNPTNKNLLVSDCVVNWKSERNLWTHNMDTNKTEMIGKFFSPPQYTGPERCDLHPRWSPKGDLIAIDSAHNNIREIVVIDTTKTT